jgi:hypothetical protein
MVGQWSGSPLVCEPPCLTLTLPENADTCSKLLLDEDFTPTGSTLARWSIAPVVPASVSGSFWFLDNGRPDCGSVRSICVWKRECVDC